MKTRALSAALVLGTAPTQRGWGVPGEFANGFCGTPLAELRLRASAGGPPAEREPTTQESGHPSALRPDMSGWPSSACISLKDD
jgi:hypothetical protein